jgi:hypothetical protein
MGSFDLTVAIAVAPGSYAAQEFACERKRVGPHS